MKVAIVAPAAGGHLDLVGFGVNGLLFPPSDGTFLRAAVTALVRDDALRARPAAGALPSVRSRIWEAVCDRLLSHYSEVIHDPGAPHAGRASRGRERIPPGRR